MEFLHILDKISIKIRLFTNEKGRLAPLTCHIIHETLKSLDNSINTKSEKIRHKNS